MKDIFKVGDKKTFKVTVSPADTASFEAVEVHPVYATFALGRDAEWACRLFVLEMKEADEEGIGTMLNIDHVSPALVGSQVCFEAIVDSINQNEIICTFQAKVGDRLIAKGMQGQKIIKKARLEALFSSHA